MGECRSWELNIVVLCRVTTSSTITPRDITRDVRGMVEVRLAEPSVLILTSLSGGPRHGYALIKDIEQIAAVTLGPGTLYGALSRLEQQGMVVALPVEDRRRPYEITPAGTAAVQVYWENVHRLAVVGLRRLGAYA